MANSLEVSVMAVSVKEVESTLTGFNSVNVARIPKEFQALAELEPVYIYNVSHKSWQQQTGLGRFIIQACQPGKKYSVPIILPSMLFETVMVDFKKQEQRPVSGME